MIFAQAAFAMGLNADIDKIVLTYNGLPVFASSTPYSVGFEGGFKDGLLELTAHLKQNWLKDPEAAIEEEAAAAFNAPIMQESTEDIGISSCQQITIKLRNSKNKICEISVQLVSKYFCVILRCYHLFNARMRRLLICWKVCRRRPKRLP